MSKTIQQPWLASYPEDVPEEIELKYANLAVFLEDLFARYAELPAFTSMGKTLSFAEIGERARAFATYLQQDLGMSKGARLAIMLPNIVQFPVVFYACLLSGVEVVNVNPLYTASELEQQLADSEARAIVIAENFSKTLGKVRKRLPHLQQVVLTGVGDELGWVKGLAVNWWLRYVKRAADGKALEGAVDYKEVLKRGRRLQFVTPDLALEDVAMLQYTGGTTGTPKGAMLTHRNLLANIAQIDAWIGQRITEPSLVLVTALPLYHVFCCSVNLLCFPNRAMHSLLIANPRDMRGFVKTLRRYPFAVMTVVNTLLKGLLQTPEFEKLDFSSLRFVVSGGMALAPKVANRWQEVTGNVIIEGYGLTETAPLLTVNLLENEHYTDGIGYPVPSTLLSLRDEAGKVVANGEAGEIWVKGPQVMKGYWRQAEENERAFSADGWFKTGDVGVMSETGFVRLVDRKKRLIVVSGFNVYPSEVERVLAEDEKVAEVACVGCDDEDSGERVVAVVVLKEQEAQAQAKARLQELAKAQLTSYKRPKNYLFVEALPKSAVGKVLYQQLVEMAEQEDIKAK